MHILQITIFFKRGVAYTKGCYSQNMVCSLGKYHIMQSEKWCAIATDISDVLTCTMCSPFKKIYCEKGIACARGFILVIEVDQDMPYFNGMLYRALPFYKRHALVFRNVWTCAYPRVWAKNVIIKISSTHALAAYVFACVQHSFWEITFPVAPAFCHSCLHCLLMEPQAQST